MTQLSEPVLLNRLLETLPTIAGQHRRGTPLYGLLDELARAEVKKAFASNDATPVHFGFFGELRFPYRRMGAIDTLDLFGLDELLIFSFYWVNRTRYRRALDIGANLGLHSILLSRCGLEVRSYEPDPVHFELLKKNLELNRASSVTPIQAAVSNREGSAEFVRVLGNTTGSHLAGAKSNPYGELERFPVRLEEFRKVLAWADLVKMDVEGHEKELLLSTTAEDWVGRDAMIEIGTPENAAGVFEHLRAIGLQMFPQKKNWQRAERLEDLPTSYKEGSLFLSRSDRMNWGADTE